MSPALPALDRARAKAYRRLIPLVFISYVIAFIDRANVASAGSEMVKDLPGFFIAGPIALILGPNISRLMIDIGVGANPLVMGLKGWQWIYIFWGIPAVIMGVVVFFGLTDRPHQAKWLTEEERTALEDELRREREQDGAGSHHLGLRALFDDGPTLLTVILLSLAYFFGNAANYGVDFFLPSILTTWYGHTFTKPSTILFFGSLPYIIMLLAQIWIGRRSDRTGERWLHAAVPVFFGALMLAIVPSSQGTLVLTLVVFGLILGGIRGYLPAFWALPSLLLRGTAAAAAIGFINSFGNLGGFLGSIIMGKRAKGLASFDFGLYVLAGCALISATIILGLAVWHRRKLAATTSAELPAASSVRA